MRQKRRKQILALVALLVTVFAPQEVERACCHGAAEPSPRINCVHALFPSLELEFAPPARPGSASTAARSPAGGSVAPQGTLDELEYERSLPVAWAVSAPGLALALLPRPSVAVFLPTAEVIGRGIEIRGPPLPLPPFRLPLPRAPPAA